MKLLLGITGSISAYKCYDLVRGWVKKGHQVQIVLTQGGEKFVKPDLFLSLGAERVWGPQDDFLSPQSPHFIPHIELSKWCDRLIVAPLSANTLSKLAMGLADDLLTTLFLALDHKPVILYPAMNTHMLNHPIIQANLKKLADLPFVFIHPSEEGLLACGDFGQGKLPSVESIGELAPIITPRLNRLAKHFIITTGATQEHLDPVRYMTNPSTGLTGYILAKEILSHGHRVTLIAGRGSLKEIDFLKAIPWAKVIRVAQAKEMEDAVLTVLPQSDAYIGSAAISDFEFTFQNDKIKREALTGTISYRPAPDILQSVLAKRGPHQVVVGFAAETATTETIFYKKWKRKPVDLLVGNRVHCGVQNSEKQQGFGTQDGHYFFIEEGKITQEMKFTKEELAKSLYSWIEQRLVPSPKQ